MASDQHLVEVGEAPDGSGVDITINYPALKSLTADWFEDRGAGLTITVTNDTVPVLIGELHTAMPSAS